MILSVGKNWTSNKIKLIEKSDSQRLKTECHFARILQTRKYTYCVDTLIWGSMQVHMNLFALLIYHFRSSTIITIALIMKILYGNDEEVRRNYEPNT